MDVQPINWTGPPPDPDDLPSPDTAAEFPPDSSSDPQLNDSSPTPPSQSTNSPQEDLQDDAPPPPQSQDPPPSSQVPPQNSPPPPPFPSGQQTPTLLILPPPFPPGTSLVPPGVPPADSTSNTISAKSQSSGGGAIGDTGFVAIGVVSGYVLLGVIGLAVWWLCYRKNKVSAEVGPGMPTSSGSPQSDSLLRKMRSSPANDSIGSHQESRNLYSYEELAKATSEFSESNLLGEGGFGSVFKGRLPDGRVVAVKQLKDGGGQGEREFRAEVETISRIHHRHLVSLIGYCICDDLRLLVYDYVPNNTLHFHLHGPGKIVLDWSSRIKIATGAARGIAYLHEDCHPRIVHRDIKSSNILLHNNFEAQVSDFGLARLFSDIHTHVTTRVMGTFGYMAPEYASSGILTEKSDVFSFGVVLLELITGRKPVDMSQPLGEESLVEWARPLLNHALEKEEFENLVDPRLEEDYVSSEMFRVIEAAAACVRYSALRRPKMSRILRAFDDMSLSDPTNGMTVDESEIIDSARTSAEMRLFRRMAFSSQDYSTTDFLMLNDLESEEK